MIHDHEFPQLQHISHVLACAQWGGRGQLAARSQKLPCTATQTTELSGAVSWFYDFWLLAFHIITSCSALGSKELMLQFWAPVWERRTTYPGRLCSQKGDITPGKITWCPFFFSSALLPAARPDHTHRCSATVRPTALRYSLIIFDLLASVIIIWYYNVLSCILIPYLVN